MADSKVRLYAEIITPASSDTDRSVKELTDKIGKMIGKGITTSMERSLYRGRFDKIIADKLIGPAEAAINRSLDRIAGQINNKFNRTIASISRKIQATIREASNLAGHIDRIARMGGGAAAQQPIQREFTKRDIAVLGRRITRPLGEGMSFFEQQYFNRLPEDVQSRIMRWAGRKEATDRRFRSAFQRNDLGTFLNSASGQKLLGRLTTTQQDRLQKEAENRFFRGFTKQDVATWGRRNMLGFSNRDRRQFERFAPAFRGQVTQWMQGQENIQRLFREAKSNPDIKGFMSSKEGMSLSKFLTPAQQNKLQSLADKQVAAAERAALAEAKFEKARAVIHAKNVAKENKAEDKRIQQQAELRTKLTRNAEIRNRMASSADVLSDRVIGSGHIGTGGNRITTWSARPTWFRGQGGATFFRNAVEETLNDKEEHTTRELMGTSGWSRLKSRVLGDGPKIVQAFRGVSKSLDLVKSGLTGVGRAASFPLHGLRAIGNTAIRLAAISYGIRRIGHLAYSAITGPTSRMVEGTERSRLFELTMNRAAGGPMRARAFNRALVQESMGSGMSVDDFREVSRQYATMPMLSSRLIGKTPQQQAQEIRRFGEFGAMMGTLDPSQGVAGAMISIREALAGDVQSLRRRLEISPAVVAAGSGQSLEKLKGDPELMLQALRKYAETYVGRESIQGRENLVSTQMQHLRDLLNDSIMPMIGESGVFDSLVQRLKKLKDGLANFFQPGNQEWESRARKISAMLDRYVGSLLEAGEKFISGFTGEEARLDNLPGILDSAMATMNRVVQLVEQLPGMAQSLGESLAFIGRQIGGFIDRLSIADAVIGEKGLTNGPIVLATDKRVKEIINASPKKREAMKAQFAIDQKSREDEIRRLNKERMAIGAASLSNSDFVVPREVGGALLNNVGQMYGLSGADANNPKKVREAMIAKSRAELAAANKTIVGVLDVMPKKITGSSNRLFWNNKLLDAKLQQSNAIRRYDEISSLPANRFDLGSGTMSARDVLANYRTLSGKEYPEDNLKKWMMNDRQNRIQDLLNEADNERWYGTVLNRTGAANMFDISEFYKKSEKPDGYFHVGDGPYYVTRRAPSQKQFEHSPFSPLVDNRMMALRGIPNLEDMFGPEFDAIAHARKLQAAVPVRRSRAIPARDDEALVTSTMDDLISSMNFDRQQMLKGSMSPLDRLAPGGLVSKLSSDNRKLVAAMQPALMSFHAQMQEKLDAVYVLLAQKYAEGVYSEETVNATIKMLEDQINNDLAKGLSIDGKSRMVKAGAGVDPAIMARVNQSFVERRLQEAREISALGDGSHDSLLRERDALVGGRNQAVALMKGVKADPSHGPLGGLWADMARKQFEKTISQFDKAIQEITERILDSAFRIEKANFDHQMREIDGATRAAEFGVAGDILDVTPAQIRAMYAGDWRQRAMKQMKNIPLRMEIARQSGEKYDKQATAMADTIAQAEASGAPPEHINQLKDDYATILDRQQDASQRFIDLRNQYDELNLATNDAFADIVEFSARSRQALEDGLGRGIGDLILGFGDLGDVARNFAQDIVRIWSDMAAKNLVAGLLGGFGQPSEDDPTGMRNGGGLFGGFLSGLFGGMFGGGASSGSHVNQGFTVRPAAKGGVFMGGLHVPSFASGGVVRKPTFALIGDAAGNPTRGSEEAVLPLVRAQGKLGVAAHGIGAQQSAAPNIIVVGNHEEAARAAVQMELRSPGSRSTIVDVWSDNYMSGGKTFKATRAKR